MGLGLRSILNIPAVYLILTVVPLIMCLV